MIKLEMDIPSFRGLVSEKTTVQQTGVTRQLLTQQTLPCCDVGRKNKIKARLSLSFLVGNSPFSVFLKSSNGTGEEVRFKTVFFK